MPPDALQRGVVQLGHAARLKSALERAAAGEHLHIVFAGGSNTQIGGGKDGFVTRVKRFLSDSSLTGNGQRLIVTNAGIGGTTSYIFEACIDVYVPLNASIYVVELTINDPSISNCYGNPAGTLDVCPQMCRVRLLQATLFPCADEFDTPSRRAMERIIRRLLGLPQQPAVIMLQYYSHFRWGGKFYYSAGASNCSNVDTSMD